MIQIEQKIIKIYHLITKHCASQAYTSDSDGASNHKQKSLTAPRQQKQNKSIYTQETSSIIKLIMSLSTKNPATKGRLQSLWRLASLSSNTWRPAGFCFLFNSFNAICSIVLAPATNISLSSSRNKPAQELMSAHAWHMIEIGFWISFPSRQALFRAFQIAQQKAAIPVAWNFLPLGNHFSHHS